MSLSISFFVGPAVGAVIGYFTNYLAVKMLFRPYTEKRIGRLRLPFTPGVIPRRRKDLARALGEAVGKRLVTREDLAALLLSDDSVKALTDVAVQTLFGDESSPISRKLASLLGEDNEKEAKEGIDLAITDAVAEALASADLGTVLLREGVAALRIGNPMLGMFLGDELIERIAPAVNERLSSFLQENGRAQLLPAVEAQTSAILADDLPTLLGKIGLSREMLSAAAERAVKGTLTAFLPVLLDHVDLCSIVESKINEMDVRELEALILSVMKRELGAVVNLGAVIGFVLGFITAFF
jgi:uncharacterized membrane protein YheB (UPF0754 family)